MSKTKWYTKTLCHCERSVAILVALALVLSLAIVALPMAGTVAASTITVGPSPGSYNYTSIQAAINAASSGDTINVAAGTYDENLNITKALTLKGESVASVTLNPTTTSYAIGVSSAGNDVTIENLTIGAGSATNFLVHVSHVSNFTIQNVKVVGGEKPWNLADNRSAASI